MLYAALSLALVLAVLETIPRLGGWALLQRTGIAVDAGDGDLRILCVGDSYTYGMGTAPNLYSWPRQLERLIRERNPSLTVSVRNAGVPGQSSGEILVDLTSLLEKTRPQIVCVLVGLNNQWKFREPKWPALSSLEPAKSLLRHLRVYRVLHWTLSRSAPRSWLGGARSNSEKQPRQPHGVVQQYQPGKTGLLRGLRGPRDFGSTTRESFRRAVHRQLRDDLSSMAHQIGATGAALVVVTYPEGREPAKKPYKGVELLETLHKEVAAHLLLSLADVRPAFTAAKERVGRDRLISPDGSHPTGEGYSVMAACAYDAVRDACGHLSSPIALAPSPAERGPSPPDYGTSDARAELDRWALSSNKRIQSRSSLEYALMLADAGLLDEAIASMERYHQRSGAHNLASRMLAGLYRRAGRLNDERSFCERMVARDPTFDYYRNRLAELDSLAADPTP